MFDRIKAHFFRKLIEPSSSFLRGSRVQVSGDFFRPDESSVDTVELAGELLWGGDGRLVAPWTISAVAPVGSSHSLKMCNFRSGLSIFSFTCMSRKGLTNLPLLLASMVLRGTFSSVFTQRKGGGVFLLEIELLGSNSSRAPPYRLRRFGRREKMPP